MLDWLRRLVGLQSSPREAGARPAPKGIALPFSKPDLRVALNRTLYDHDEGRGFSSYPYLADLVRASADEWLDRLAGEQWTASPARVMEVLKPGGLIRPGAVLTLEDQVVYGAAVGTLVDGIRERLRTVDPPADFAYAIPDNGFPDDRWFEGWFKGEEAFRRETLRLLEPAHGYEYVVEADIAGFYEHVSLEKLTADLEAVGASKPVRRIITSGLTRWGPLQKRGLPQGHSASDLLGKLYLHEVDEALRDAGLHHLRYVDDYRIFARNEMEAREALRLLVRVLARRGLVLQTAKSRILTRDDAKLVFADVNERFDPIREELEERLAQLGVPAGPSNSMFALDELLEEQGDARSVVILEQAFNRFCPLDGRFDKRMYRFLLGKLGRAGSLHPLPVALEALWVRPEETPATLKYLARVDAVSDAEGRFLYLLREGRITVPSQALQFLRWRFALDAVPGDAFLRAIRDLGPLSNDEFVARYVDAILGRWGSAADRTAMIERYSEMDLSRRPELICCIRAVPNFERNAFLGRAKDDGPLCTVAADLVKGGGIGFP